MVKRYLEAPACPGEVALVLHGKEKRKKIFFFLLCSNKREPPGTSPGPPKSSSPCCSSQREPPRDKPGASHVTPALRYAPIRGRRTAPDTIPPFLVLVSSTERPQWGLPHFVGRLRTAKAGQFHDVRTMNISVDDGTGVQDHLGKAAVACVAVLPGWVRSEIRRNYGGRGLVGRGGSFRVPSRK